MISDFAALAGCDVVAAAPRIDGQDTKDSGNLKILIVSWYFPPVNTIGALRVGKFARFLIERGHDIGVVAGRDWGFPETQPLGVPLERIAYATAIDVDAAGERMRRLLTKIRPARASLARTADPPSGSRAHGEKSALRRFGELYHYFVNLPDKQVGWLPWAYGASRRLCARWRPDLIFASAPPFTGLLVARLLSARLGVPWIAELRDRWADDPYEDPPRWRLAVDQWLERRVLTPATALVTVTEPWSEFYRRKYGKPVATVYNGYDPLDFDFDVQSEPQQPEQLVIGYTGHIYPGRRDPSPLFAALRLLGEDRRRYRVVFHGSDPAQVLPFAERAGVLDLVEVRPSIPYKESLAFQSRADVLLLMQWNDPRDYGHCPAKFFEYLASLRPVLILGREDSVAATIARERGAGFCANEPGAIAERLAQWRREKDTFGEVRALPAAAREGLSRRIQFEKLERFLCEVARGTAPKGP